ncbi:S8 family serine peptidase [Bacillus suaedae]|uniref:Cell wall-binding repeat-containing protein n=1 Tax=Halalkalibacter suaedae TaxID=2822140 RepID=A0A940WP69_9BACI|nr:S8 family serine peptidase [Bacillus suaedae]MBP3950074.1 cell wall-binding repeat-containing protein [Bacillus suaedae]
MKKIGIILIIFLSVFIVSNVGLATEEEIVIKKKTVSSYQSTEVNEDYDMFEFISVDEADYQDQLDKWENDPEVEYVEEEIFYEYTNVNDTYFDYQLKDFSLLNVTEAWSLYRPAHQSIVAVLDSGVNINHPDLKEKIYKPFNVYDSTNIVTDFVGHGTHVAGLVGAQTNNGIGIAAIAKDVLIMPVKVGDKRGASNANIVKGIQYAAQNGATIINLSLGGYDYSKAIHDAVKAATEQGILIIASAGNDGVQNKMYPAAYPEVLSVGAVNSSNKQLAPFSNFGDWVNIKAPGVNLYSTCVKGTMEPFTECQSSNPYLYSSGTSMASPLVASVAAMLKNQAPSLSNKQNRYLLEASAQSDIINAQLANDRLHTESRISGKTSSETALALAKYGWQTIGETELIANDPKLNPTLSLKQGRYIVLASNQSFPDSLAASGLAAKLDSPIALTRSNSIDAELIEALSEYQVTDIIIVGGKAAITEEVETSLRDSGFGVHRISGSNRYETATMINNYVARQNGEVIIASGQNYPDALSISAYAAKLGIPIVFVEKDRIPHDTKAFLQKYQFNRAYVIGGTAAISDSTMKQLPNPIRISGTDRYETNIKVHNYFKNELGEKKGYLLTTGRKFPDALAGGMVSAKESMPILLVEPNRLPSKVKSYLKTEVENSSTKLTFLAIGGRDAISTDVKWQVDQIIYQDFYDFNTSQATDKDSSL